MAKTADVGAPVSPLLVVDGEVNNLFIEFCRAKEEIKIAEGVKIAEEGASRNNIRVICAPEHLGAAERILEPLPEYPAEENPKTFIGNKVE